VGVDRYRVCELYAASPDVEGSGSGFRLGDRLVLTARRVIAPAVALAGTVQVPGFARLSNGRPRPPVRVLTGPMCSSPWMR
jgi:hypothetical protein